MNDVMRINEVIRVSSSEIVEQILYSCIDKLNLIDVHTYCLKYGCKRDNIYKKIKYGKINSVVIERKYYIIQGR